LGVVVVMSRAIVSAGVSVVCVVSLVAAGCGRDEPTRVAAGPSDTTPSTVAEPEGDPTPAGTELYRPPEGYPEFSMLIPSPWTVVETASDEGQGIEFTTADGRSTLHLFMLQLGMSETELRIRAQQIADSVGSARERVRRYPWSTVEWDIVDGGGDGSRTGALIAASYGDLRYTVLLRAEPGTEFLAEAERALASWMWHQEAPVATARTVRGVVGELPSGVPAILLTAMVDGVATIEYDDTTAFVFDDGTPASQLDLRVGATIEATGSPGAEATLRSSRVVLTRP
jgi:hypothetical protein